MTTYKFWGFDLTQLNLSSIQPISSFVAPVLFIPIILITYIGYSLLKSYFPLRHIPGPLPCHFSSLPLASKVFGGNSAPYFDSLHIKYGPLVRIGPNSLLLSDFAELSRIQGVRSSYKRSNWNTALRVDSERFQDSLITILDPKQHTARKEKLRPGFSGPVTAGGKGRSWDRVLDERINELIALLRRYAREDKPVDWAKLSRFFISDVTTAAVMGKPLGWVKDESDTFGIFEIADRLIRWRFGVAFLPPVRRLTSSWWFHRRVGPISPRKQGGLGRWWRVVREELKRRSQNPEEKHDDMLSEWLAQGMSPHECEQDAVLALAAGSDTTSSTLRTILLYLISSPHSYNKLKAEILQGIKDGTISNPSTNAEARNLPYLQAVLHEGIRIMPSAIIGFPKCVPPGGDTICGYHVPEGTDIFHSHRAVMYDTGCFGEDVSTFRPERWLECSPEQKAQMTRHVESIFGFGRWQCLGRGLAWTEMNKLVVELMRNFDFQIVNPANPWRMRTYATVAVERFFVRVTEAVF